MTSEEEEKLAESLGMPSSEEALAFVLARDPGFKLHEANRGRPLRFRPAYHVKSGQLLRVVGGNSPTQGTFTWWVSRAEDGELIGKVVSSITTIKDCTPLSAVSDLRLLGAQWR